MDQHQINFMNSSFEPFHSGTSRSFRDVHISSNPRFLYSTRVSQPNHFHSLFQLDISKLICTWKSLPNLLLLLFRGQCWIHCLRGVYGPIRKPKYFMEFVRSLKRQTKLLIIVLRRQSLVLLIWRRTQITNTKSRVREFKPWFI